MSKVARSVIIHGHFYQPPREDPWFDVVEREPSAAPFHDWNQRIERECYRAVVAARVSGPEGRIADIRNTLASISFDVGPTLFEWLEREARPTYQAILEADRRSRNAIAMPYHHVILPLASRRDKVTEVRWGIADFRRRYGREPVGMWLPETAVDDETLDVLAAEGMRFTVLAPHQVRHAPLDGSPGVYRTGGGHRIALFVYHGPISHDVAFGGLLRDASAWAARMTQPGPDDTPPLLTTVATDGETYGHHHRFGEMALAALLGQLERRPGVTVENFAAFLERHPAREPVELVAPSSWSCPHGVGRWHSDCGCRLAPERPTQQRWRQPLRAGLDWLAGELHTLFEREAWELLGDPWTLRDQYGAAAAAGGDAIGTFVAEQLTGRGLWSEARGVRARELLEMERDALRMFTSCGWFFDDVTGIETAQILKYAAHAIELAGSEGPRLQAGLVEWLSQAPGNEPHHQTGRDVYQQVAHQVAPAPVRAVAAFAALRALEPEAAPPAGCFLPREEQDHVVLTNCRTGRTHRFLVTLEEVGSPRLVAVVARPDGKTEEWRVSLAQLPERSRELVRAALRNKLAARCLSPESRAAVAAGDADLIQCASRELEQAVRALADGGAPEQPDRIIGLADLLEVLDQPVPFDVQTAFHHVRQRAGPERSRILEPVARRLGFA